MSHKNLLFLAIGIIAGLLTTVASHTIPLLAFFAPGVFFFAALVAVIIATQTPYILGKYYWRHIAAYIIITGSYICALLVMTLIAAYFEGVEFGFPWIGMACGGITAALIIQFAIYVLCGLWSGRMLFQLSIASVMVVISIAVVMHIPALTRITTDWFFYALLYALGDTAFIMIIARNFLRLNQNNLVLNKPGP